jgi:hypothetical protein
MAGRAMTGYVLMPPGWQKKPDAARAWVVTALSWSRALAPKGAKAKPANKAAAKKKPS